MSRDCPDCVALRRELNLANEELASWRDRRDALRNQEEEATRLHALTSKLRAHGLADVGRPAVAYCLSHLMASPGVVRTKESLLHACAFGDPSDVELKIVDVYICMLRKGLAALGLDGVICTVWGQGYLIPREAAERVREVLPEVFA